MVSAPLPVPHSDISVAMIVARTHDSTINKNVIGKDGDMPWRLSSDLKYFKATTLGAPVIMGRKTWDSLPIKPLPGRANIVLSRKFDMIAPGARVFSTLSNAMAVAKSIAAETAQKQVFIMGGGILYEAAFPLADTLYITEVEVDIDGDTYFPEFDESQWREEQVEQVAKTDRDSHPFTFRKLVRR